MNSVSLHSSASPLLGYQLPDWSVESVPDGSYLLRLTVTNQQGDVFRDQMTVVLDRVMISSLRQKARSGRDR